MELGNRSLTDILHAESNSKGGGASPNPRYQVEPGNEKRELEPLARVKNDARYQLTNFKNPRLKK